MGKISIYPEATPPSLDDFVIGTDTSDSLSTKNFVISDILDLYPTPYKSYIAYFDQSGSFDPEVTVVYNTIGNIVWERSTQGSFVGTLEGAFTDLKTFFPNQKYCIFSDGSFVRNIFMSRLDEDTIVINQSDGDSYVDNLFLHLEIRVYN